MRIRREAEELILAVANELGPVRLLLGDLGDEIAGATGPGVSYILGIEGDAIALNPFAFRHRLRGARGQREWQYRSCALAAVIHELAHVYDRRLGKRFAFAALGSAGNPKYIDHEQRFLRACIHLDVRAAARGFRLDLGDVVPWPLYGLSSPWAYAIALGDEPIDRIEEPLLQVLASPAPAALDQLFVADISSE